MTGDHPRIVRKRGDTLELTVAVQNPDGTEKLLLGLRSVRYGIARWTGGPPLLSLSLGSGVQITSPGVVSVKADLAGLAPGDYCDELEVCDAGGNVATVWAGPIRIVPGVLR